MDFNIEMLKLLFQVVRVTERNKPGQRKGRWVSFPDVYFTVEMKWNFADKFNVKNGNCYMCSLKFM